MNGDLALRGMLAANASFTAHSTNIFYEEADQTTVLPFSIVNLSSTEASDTDTGVSTLDFDHVILTMFAETKLKVSEMALDARNAVDRQIGQYNNVVVESVQFEDQWSGSEFLADKRVFTISQRYQVMNQIQHYFDYYFDFQFE